MLQGSSDQLKILRLVFAARGGLGIDVSSCEVSEKFC
jgi:hypothetical protein